MSAGSAAGAERGGGPPSSVPGTTLTVSVATLAGAVSPLRSVDERWVARLAAAGPPFTPVVVSAAGALVDGAHRVRAALVLGVTSVPARVVEAETEAELVAAALHANRGQVKPLSRPERKAAALRLIAAGPDWSDRAIARAAGCSHTSVARWRAAAGPPTGTPAEGGEHDPCEDGQSTTAPGAGVEPARRADGQSTTPGRCDLTSHRPASEPSDTVGAMGRGPARRRRHHRAGWSARRWLGQLGGRLRRGLGQTLRRWHRTAAPNAPVTACAGEGDGEGRGARP